MTMSRGRVYVLEPDRERFGVYAEQVAYMDEQAARLLDLVAELPEEVANAVPEGGENSIHALCLHMAWAERHWLARTVTGEELPPSAQPRFVLPPDAFTRPWSSLSEMLVDQRATHVHAVIADVAAGRATFTATPQFPELRQVLDHLTWHWIYHGGQVGLLRRLLGPRYSWTFAKT